MLKAAIPKHATKSAKASDFIHQVQHFDVHFLPTFEPRKIWLDGSVFLFQIPNSIVRLRVLKAKVSTIHSISSQGFDQ